METERGHVAEAARRPAPVRRPGRTRRVLDNEQPVPVGDRPQLVVVRALPERVDRHLLVRMGNHTGFRELHRRRAHHARRHLRRSRERADARHAVLLPDRRGSARVPAHALSAGAVDRVRSRSTTP